ncbi:hypothetical protein BG011_007068 [Mortierella polycephala]|uniref:BTB domain-containing protein n=1 Tax=Mortierella polycephala TaxID=41804 RepID=A0A9P6QAK6_9FUNG|nr:hypothetical protein BG011_007068 [Mortierella polycephala]
MRTAELINLLRSHDRTSPSTKAHLAALDQSRVIHLLGELSNWQLVELRKYHDRQAGPTAPETQQQGSIRGQIRNTLLAIQVVLDSATALANESETETGTGFGSFKAETSKTSMPAVLLDDKHKDKILERFLKPILIGMAPLGSRIDSTSIQQMCAKIICFCTSPSTRNAPFPPQDVARKMISMSGDGPEHAGRSRGEMQSSNGNWAMESKADAVVGLSSLLRSPVIKLQEYAIRILTSHRFLIQMDRSWEILPYLRPVLEALKDNLGRMISDLPTYLFDLEVDINNGDLEIAEKDQNGVGTSDQTRGELGKDLEMALEVQSKGLVLLQCFFQEAAKGIAPSNPTKAADPQDSVRNRLEKLNLAADMSLLTDLWTATLHIVLVDKLEFSASDRLILATSATIYWSCWVFRDPAYALVMAEGSDTLMAWYSYYIIPRDHQGASSGTIATEVAETTTTSRLISKDLKHQGSVLEYLSKLILNLVSPKCSNLTLFSGRRPVVILMIRRTIEFLENILESSLPLVEPPIPGQEDLQSDSTKTVSHSVGVIRQKPGILDAMLGILVGCFGVTREGDDLMLRSRLLNALVLLLSDIQNLFAIPHLPRTTARRIHQLSLNLLHSILSRHATLPEIEDIAMMHWELGYKGLVSLIMLPLEKEMDAISGPVDEPDAKEESLDMDIGLKGLRVFSHFWKHHAKGRYILSDLFGPRFYQTRMIGFLVDQRKDSTPQIMKITNERTKLLLESMVYFGVESGVRINMRERWSSLPFITMLLGASMKRLESCWYSVKDTLSRMVAHACFQALRNFWYDRQGLLQLIDLDISQAEVAHWESRMPSSLVSTELSSPLSHSIVPLLLSILAPPGTTWSSQLMLGSDGAQQNKPRRLRQPLMERNDIILIEAALMLAQLSQFLGCQQRLVIKPGAVWMLCRMTVERSLIADKERDRSIDPSITVADPDDGASRDQLEKALFETLTKVMSAPDLAKSLVSNNTITELFAAVVEMDRPFWFHRTSLVLESPRRTMAGAAETNKGDVEMSIENSVNTHAYPILPVPSQHDLHQQLLRHFQTAMAPLRDQFERIYQYVGGRRSLQNAGDSGENVYWLREYCALVYLYTMEQPSAASPLQWGSKIDKAALLNSESVFGVACRMLTLEIEYDSIDEVQDAEQISSQDPTATSSRHEDIICAEREEATLRRFSAGLAIQSLSWAHVDRWRRQHQELMHSFAGLKTTEWQAHVAALNDTTDPAEEVTPIEFLVKDRVISFPDRLCLSRSSSYFHTLLLGDYMESFQHQIQLQDVDPDELEMLLEVLKESRLTVDLLLPEDLPFATVLRLMVCADRFMVGFVKRLAEAWILETLSARELKHYELEDDASAEAKSGDANLKHIMDTSAGGIQDKRLKLDDNAPNINQDGDQHEDVFVMENQGRSQANDEDVDKDEEDEESIQECLLLVYEICTATYHGNIYNPEHTFFALVWDVLKRMILRLGSVAITPRFAAMLDHGGEEKISELLQALYELVLDTSP